MDFSFRMPVERVRHDYLWFEDGSVVLQAEDKADSTRDILFRVHKGILSKHSSVFAGMFALPGAKNQKENKKVDVNEMYEGVPLVRMPDTSEQIEALLYVFYDPLYLKVDARDPDLPLKLAPLMTVVKKYEVDTVGTYITKQFETVWPANLEEWDNVEQNTPTNSLSKTYAHKNVLEPAAMIKFARNFDLNNVLAAAFYELSRCHYTESCPPSGSQHGCNPERRCARWGLLSAHDLLTLGQLKEILERLPDAPSIKSFMCNACREQLERTLERIKLEALSSRDILRVLQKYGKDKIPTTICGRCRESASRRFLTLRSELWASIERIVNKEAE